METVATSLAEFEAEAARFALCLMPQRSTATLVTLTGNLGAGKTAYAKAVAKALGVAEVVTSPTFVLEKIYQLPQGRSFKRLVHIDAYRLEKGEELAPLGFDESMQDVGNLIVLEWPEKVASTLPEPTIKISIVPLPDNARQISYG